MQRLYYLASLLLLPWIAATQEIADFISVEPLGQNTDFIIPSSHVFQKLIETGDALTAGGILPGKLDFTGYVPISGSSVNGYISLNSELPVGNVAILDINFNGVSKLWQVTASESLDFSAFGGTSANCSGTVTAWNTVISCEEVVIGDFDFDGYNDRGWAIELDPFNKTVLHRLYSMGSFKHENATIHSNGRTVYQGADSNPGYLFKFVADLAQNLQAGTLYVYKGSKSGSGNWIQLTDNTSTMADQNNTLTLCSNVGATVFNGVEDVEIGPDGMIYFAVKNEDAVYRFSDSDPISGTTVPLMETYVGGPGVAYDIKHASGTTSVTWGRGNDNMAFDAQGNLWVLQDGDDDYIWVVKEGHTTVCPRVEIFGRTPLGSEPTGITFSPDNKFLFMSIQHPNSSNNTSSQTDAAGASVNFAKDVALVIARKENLGTVCPPSGIACDDNDATTINDMQDGSCNCGGTQICGAGSVCVSPQIQLGGAYASNTMRDDLYRKCLVPEFEPYTAFGYTLLNTGQGMNDAAKALLGNKAIIDWVVVQLRNMAGTVIFSKAALLRKDGQVVGPDGTSAVSFSGLPAGNYHVAIRHHNHLGIMSNDAVVQVP